MKKNSTKKEPLFYISPSLLTALCLIGAGYAALRSFLNKEWGRGVHDYSDEKQ